VLRKNEETLPEDDIYAEIDMDSLQPGLLYITNFVPAEELIKKNLFEPRETERVSLTKNEIQWLYEAKCMVSVCVNMFLF
jgi:hypothetical protein